jgi:hypothetical protein
MAPATSDAKKIEVLLGILAQMPTSALESLNWTKVANDADLKTPETARQIYIELKKNMPVQNKDDVTEGSGAAQSDAAVAGMDSDDAVGACSAGKKSELEIAGQPVTSGSGGKRGEAVAGLSGSTPTKKRKGQQEFKIFEDEEED